MTNATLKAATQTKSHWAKTTTKGKYVNKNQMLL